MKELKKYEDMKTRMNEVRSEDGDEWGGYHEATFANYDSCQIANLLK